MKNTFIKLFFSLLFFSSAVFFSIFIAGRYNIIVDILFVSIILQSSVYIFFFGGILFKIYSTFSYFFFGFVPYLEYKTNTVYWGGAVIADSTYYITNIVLIILNFVFLFSYMYFFNGKKQKIKGIFFEELSLNGWKCFFVFFGIVLVSLAFILYLNNFSLLSLLVRGGEFKELTIDASPLLSILSTFFRALPMFAGLFYIAFSSAGIIRKTLIFGVAILSAFPMSMPRFMVAAFYLPMFLVFYPWLRVRANLQLVLISGLLFVFPFLNTFRNWNYSININFFDTFSSLLEGHFDSYQSFARVIQLDLITWGYQLLGPLLFFIPRSIWPSKPIGSGAEMARIANLSFSNIAANWYAEGYINFGFFGVFVFCVFLAYCCAKLDFLYRALPIKLMSPFHLMYFIIAGYLFFILRGDLMSSMSFGAGLGVAYFAAMFISKAFSRKLRNI